MVTLSNMLTAKLESHDVEKPIKEVVNWTENQRKSRINNRKSLYASSIRAIGNWNNKELKKKKK